MSAYVACDLAAARGMPHMNRIAKIECGGKFRKIVRVRIKVVSVPGLTRSAVAAPVVCDASITPRSEKKHLILKGVCRQRPAVAEDNWLTGPPVFEVNLRAVFSRNRVHGCSCSALGRPDGCGFFSHR
jgi:hypothetical protein